MAGRQRLPKCGKWTVGKAGQQRREEDAIRRRDREEAGLLAAMQKQKQWREERASEDAQAESEQIWRYEEMRAEFGYLARLAEDDDDLREPEAKRSVAEHRATGSLAMLPPAADPGGPLSSAGDVCPSSSASRFPSHVMLESSVTVIARAGGASSAPTASQYEAAAACSSSMHAAPP